MEHESITTVSQQTGLSKQELVSTVREGILHATGYILPDELINDIVEAVAMYLQARMRHPDHIDVKALQFQLQEKLTPHVDKLIEYVTAMATQYASNKGGQVYLGWLAGNVTNLVVGSIINTIITSGVNAVIEKIALTAVSTLQPITDDEFSDWVLVSETPFNEDWVVILERSGYEVVDFDIASDLVDQKFQEYQVTKYAEGPLTDYIIDDHKTPSQSQESDDASEDVYLSLHSSSDDDWNKSSDEIEFHSLDLDSDDEKDL